MKRTILALTVGLLTVSTSGPGLHTNGHFALVPFAEAAMSSKLGDLTPFRDRLMRDGVRAIAPSGVLGDPRPATREHGERYLDALTESVTRFLRGLGVTGMVVATSEAEMARGDDVQYRNWATPLAAVQLLRAIQEGQGLSQSSRALLREFMFASVTGTRRIPGLLPAGTRVEHKTGTSRTLGGLTRATNDVGIVRLPDAWHLAVAVFVADSKADEATRETVIARIARAAWDRWSGQAAPRAARP